MIGPVGLVPANDGWVDDRVTAGYQGAPVTNKLQIDERSEVAHACQHIVVSALERHPMFISAAQVIWVICPIGFALQ